MKAVEKKLNALRDEIRRHERLYYVENAPEISDYDFDQKMRELVRLEEENPELRTPDSPSLRVGGAPRKGEFPTVVHQPPMLSLENAYSLEELDEWAARVARTLGSAAPAYLAELKIDGLSIDLMYEAGTLVRAATRGDGSRGDEVTENVRTIRAIPLRIPLDEQLQVRGEIYLEKKQFARLNQQIEEDGGSPLANPRNAAAGSLRLKDPKQVAARGLSAFLYQIVRIGDGELPTQQATYEELARLGFPTSPGWRLCESIEQVRDFISEWQEKRHELPFEIDGIVIKVDQKRLQDELGTTSKAPRWAVAFKYPPEAARTVIREITYQVGRTGAITPVANFDPIVIGGSTVRRATLHNFEEVARKDIRVGDTVLVEKGGDVIPKVTAVILEERDESSKTVHPPGVCPVCDEELHQFDGEVALRCINQGCPAIVRESVLHYAARKAMNIDGLGEKIVDLFLEKGLIVDYSSLYELSAEELSKLDRWGETSAANLISQIEKSKTAELERLIFALGIRFVGERGAKLLAENLGSLERLMNATVEELVEIPEIGPKVAEAIVFYFSVDANRRRLEKMMDLGVRPTVVDRRQGNALEGKTFVVTGTLSKYRRDDIHQMIEAQGGKASGSVSSKTSYLIAGDDAGSKLEKAKKLGVPVITEDEFLELAGYAQVSGSES